MNIQYQDSNLIKNKIIKMFTKNPNRSISATFRNIRSKYYSSFFGDYPIIATIVETANAQNIKFSRFQIDYAINQSLELKDQSKKIKTELIDQLINLSYSQTELNNFRQ